MDRRSFTLFVGPYAVSAAVSGGCSTQPTNPAPTGTANDRPTFLYFYTEN